MARRLRLRQNAADVLATLNGGISKAPKEGALKAASAKFGIAPRGTTVQEGKAFTKEEYDEWRTVILGALITLDRPAMRQ